MSNINKRKTYTKEFKDRAIRIALEPGIKKCEVAKKYGISKQLLYNWISDYKKATSQGYKTIEQKEELVNEIKKLRQEVNKKEEEISILKKVLSCFASEKDRSTNL